MTCDGGSANCHFTCPQGGTWFVCPDEPYFVGCCSSDPCNNKNTTGSPCPDLHPASFNSSIESQIAPNDCIANSSANWYSCNFTTPTFLGCCSSNPCGDGCPADDLLPAAWSSSSVGQRDLFLDAANTDAATHHSRLSSGAIAGIVVGGVAALCIILAALVFLRRRRKQRQSSRDSVAYHAPSSPYQDMYAGSSPDPSVKYASGSSAGFTQTSSLPWSPNGNPRPISQTFSTSDHTVRPNHYTHLSTPPTIAELDTDHAPRRLEIHELDGIHR